MATKGWLGVLVEPRPTRLEVSLSFGGAFLHALPLKSFACQHEKFSGAASWNILDRVGRAAARLGMVSPSFQCFKVNLAEQNILEAIAASRMVAVADIRQAPPQNLIEDCAGRTWRAEGCGGGLQEEHQSSSTLFPQESRSRNVSPESWNSNNPYRPRFVDDEDNNDNDKNRDDYHQEDMVARWPVLDHERFQRALDATEEQPVLDHFILNRFLADEITPRAPVIDVSPSLSDSSG